MPFRSSACLPAAVEADRHEPWEGTAMQAGVNLEFARNAGLGLDEAMAKAATAGYRYVEPYVYSRVCLPINGHLVLESTTPYHHINVDEVEVGRLNRCRKDLGLRFSAIDAHSTLLLPQIGVPYRIHGTEATVSVMHGIAEFQSRPSRGHGSRYFAGL
jgi:hypothetical protein